MKDVCYFEYSSFSFQDLFSDRTENSISIDHSSCKSLVSNLGLESVPSMDERSCEVDHSKDYLWSKDSYLSHYFESNQLLILLVNILILVIFFMAPDTFFSVNECSCYLLNQVPLFHPLHLDWFHMLGILAFLFNDYDVSIGCIWSQVDGLSHSMYEEDDSFV